MHAFKIIGRTEELTWEPPNLSFVIERHGGTVCGSSRAELQYWVVNVESGEAGFSTCGWRQIRPMAKRLNVLPLATEVVDLVKARKEDPRLKWLDHKKVRILTGRIIPDNSPKQTVRGRRKRFAQALDALMKKEGWIRSARLPVYVREGAPAESKMKA